MTRHDTCSNGYAACSHDPQRSPRNLLKTAGLVLVVVASTAAVQLPLPLPLEYDTAGIINSVVN